MFHEGLFFLTANKNAVFHITENFKDHSGP